MFPYKYKRLLYLSPLANLRLVHYLRYLSRKRWIKKTIVKFGRENDIDSILPQMRRAFTRFHWNAEEFFLFNYESLNDEQRHSFCPEYDHNIFCLKVNDYSVARIFRDKWATYRHLKEYFKRECVFIESVYDMERDDVKTFIESNNVFMLKPVGASCGRGIRKIELNSTNYDCCKSEILSLIGQSGGYLLEPLIRQSFEMEVLHPESVNTVRIPTINYGNRIEIFHPFLRIGRGASFVDNAGSGGIGCNVDVETGTIICAGDELGNDYTVHPDSGVKLIGFRIPRWNEAIEMAKDLALTVPKVHYVGWDLALTDNGWVLIEGNEDGQFVFQFFSHQGAAKEVRSVYDKLKMIKRKNCFSPF